MEIDDKGGEVVQRYEIILGKHGFGDGYGQGGSNFAERRRIKISWTREAHK